MFLFVDWVTVLESIYHHWSRSTVDIAHIQWSGWPFQSRFYQYRLQAKRALSILHILDSHSGILNLYPCIPNTPVVAEEAAVIWYWLEYSPEDSLWPYRQCYCWSLCSRHWLFMVRHTSMPWSCFRSSNQAKPSGEKYAQKNSAWWLTSDCSEVCHMVSGYAFVFIWIR